MRASRLLTLQMLLQARGRMSARALAEALQVSVRTLHRDVDQLSAAGVPIYAERGRSGGFALLDGWKTTLTGLTPAESQAVFLGGLAGPAAQLGLGAEVENARLKLLAALPSGARAQALSVSERLHLDPIDWYREQEPVPFLALAAEAVWSGHELALHYESWRRTTTRRVGPLGLVLKAGTWYLVALIGARPSTLRVANIRGAERLDSAVQRPRGFELAAYWAESTQRFEQELQRLDATVLATPAGLKALSQVGGATARAVAAAGPGRRRDGRVRLRVPIESIEHGAGQLLRLAPEVEAVEPPELLAALRGRTRKLAALYDVAETAA
ncbi:MAG: WYL domain-containing protein [Pelomonas sp.]|nr:WYL domain-containing protein [Roseateles sp.]